MNTSKAKKTTKKEGKQERVNIEVREFEVKNVRVVEGKNGDFISFPQYKGSDGNYYNNVYVALSDEDSAKILTAIQTAIDAE